MSSSVFITTRVVCGLAAGGLALDVFVAPPAGNVIRDQMVMRAAVRDHVAVAVLGGFHALAADIVWLQMWSRWERRDWPATERRLRLACALEPESLYFWLNGARIIAYDAPAWARGMHSTAALRRQQAEAALKFLQAAEPLHRDNPQLWIERAGLELYGRNDPAAAAGCYRRAAELPGCPPFAGRLHALLLRRLGRPAEAPASLVRWRRMLPSSEAAAAGQRIRKLDPEPVVPPEKATQPAANP